MNRKEVIEDFLNWSFRNGWLAVYSLEIDEYISYPAEDLVERMLEEYLERR